MPRLEAENELRERRAQSMLTAERLHDLVLLSTGDKQKAEDAFLDFRWAELKRGETPGNER